MGEYGEHTFRPHYHAILFGVEATEDNRRLLYDSWGKSSYQRCQLEPFTVERAQYTCGYVTKKMTKKDDPRLEGRLPEYARMSLKPGLGASAMANVAEKLLQNYWTYEQLKREDNVPYFLKSGGRVLPFDRYLRSKLIEKVGLDTTLTGKLRREKIRADSLHEEMCLVSKDPEALKAFWRSKGFEPDLAVKEQKTRSLKARYSINQQGRKI